MPGTCVPVLLSLFFILALSTTLSLPPKKSADCSRFRRP
ncbi:hypothetical protein CCUS01_03373 [Colletotrichum cuscutae]|uniref:Uncharacterized protein n=1 Tax=Colletotrichum cuscutae TaxID=1209917 RepID=A0AAI9VG73_9PEZI|nr:hypothetical protein CCUS01_03373 [Colletotrichum cuscutae]